MSTRIEYETRLRDYPDLLTVKELPPILGGICDRTAFELIHKSKIKHFRIGNKYLIPKAYLIDFMMSEDYSIFKKNVEARHFQMMSKDEKIKQKILFLCEKPQIRKDLMFLLDVKSKKTFFRLYLRPLLESGELQMTHPEQPSISIQQYIRTVQSRN